MLASPSPSSEHALALCSHCNLPLAAGQRGPFCCTGCKIVHELLTAQHLEQYYDLRGPRGVPVNDVRPHGRDHKWLEPFEVARAASGSVARIDLDIQGLHCTACVWLIESLFRRHADRGALSIVVNPALGRVRFVIARDFDLAAFLAELEPFGYLFGPPRKNAKRASSDLVVRMGICIALAMNAMLFAIASYAGLRAGPTHVLLQRWNLVVSMLSLLVGGTVFFRSAWRGLQRRVLHLDIPIALGILLAFGGSLYSYAAGRSSGVYIDTVDVFIALMLVGRVLQERVLEKNRLELLASDGVDGILARRLTTDGRVETVRATTLERGDFVLVAPGDLVPLAGALLGETAAFSLDWIDGESVPRTFVQNDVVPAGAFLAGSCAMTLRATEDFAESRLTELLRTPEPRREEDAMSSAFWKKLAERYVAAVVVAAVVGFAGWMVATGDLGRSIEVATAVLVLTCPCAFGIATPLAYDLALAGLRRAGLYVRSAGFLDRAARVRQVVFDKTGTLTSGALAIDESALTDLSSLDLSVLAAMVANSAHPKSVAVQRALQRRGDDAAPDGRTEEIAGLGLRLCIEGNDYRLGASEWVLGRPLAANETKAEIAFGVNGVALASFVTGEELRSDAIAEVRALRRDGANVWLLSGDESARTTQTARLVGIDGDHAIGDHDPEAKAAWVEAHDHDDLLMVGDGLNDALVVARAFCSGTPAIDRPFMAARSDFYFVTPGLHPIRLALRVARSVTHIRRRNLTIAVAYNVLTVGLAYAGLMSPLACAVLMPASSLITILSSALSLNARSRLWRS